MPDETFLSVPPGEQTERLHRWHGQRRSSAFEAFPGGPANKRLQHHYELRTARPGGFGGPGTPFLQPGGRHSK